MLSNMESSKLYTEKAATVSLILTAVFWGLAFPILKYLDIVPAFTIMAVRFGTGALFLIALFPGKLKLITKDLLKTVFFMALAIFACYALVLIGIKYTTSARCSFFSGLNPVLVPILNFALFRFKPGRKSVIAVVLCFIGIYLISMGSNMEFGFNKGDLLSLSGSLAFSFYTIGLEKKLGNHDPVIFSIIQLSYMTVFALLGAFILDEHIPHELTAFHIAALLFLGIFSTGLTCVCQTFGQKLVIANRAALILTLEPVIGGITSMIFLGERMGTSGCIGAFIVVLSIVLSEYNPKEKT